MGSQYDLVISFIVAGMLVLLVLSMQIFMVETTAETSAITISGSGRIIIHGTGHVTTGGTAVSVTGAADAHSRVIYAPAATVTLGGSGKVTGTVIARHYIATGSADVWFATGLDEKLPPLKSAAAAAPRVRVKSWY